MVANSLGDVFERGYELARSGGFESFAVAADWFIQNGVESVWNFLNYGFYSFDYDIGNMNDTRGVDLCCLQTGEQTGDGSFGYSESIDGVWCNFYKNSNRGEGLDYVRFDCVYDREDFSTNLELFYYFYEHSRHRRAEALGGCMVR
jgi:hypothetical protein